MIILSVSLRHGIILVGVELSGGVIDVDYGVVVIVVPISKLIISWFEVDWYFLLNHRRLIARILIICRNGFIFWLIVIVVIVILFGSVVVIITIVVVVLMRIVYWFLLVFIVVVVIVFVILLLWRWWLLVVIILVFIILIFFLMFFIVASICLLRSLCFVLLIVLACSCGRLAVFGCIFEYLGLGSWSLGYFFEGSLERVVVVEIKIDIDCCDCGEAFDVYYIFD